MKVFLFLYPIREYFEEGIVGIAMRQFTEKGLRVERLSELVAARYRQTGYSVYWALFSVDGCPLLPDFSRLARQVVVSEWDVFLASGVSFREHVTREVYPDPAIVLSQLPVRVDRLVVGGFHQWDCVDKVARAASESGISTLVDEDTTELFFIRTNLFGEVPLIETDADRRRVLLRNFENEEDSEDKLMLRIQRDRRKDKPWFFQV